MDNPNTLSFDIMLTLYTTTFHAFPLISPDFTTFHDLKTSVDIRHTFHWSFVIMQTMIRIYLNKHTVNYVELKYASEG